MLAQELPRHPLGDFAMNDIHHAARTGFQRGADIYATGRPDYPPEIVTWLISTVGLGPGKRVAEIGAGTGKFLPSLIVTGADVIAVEPVEAMRSRLKATYPHIDIREGTAEAAPLRNGEVDAVVCAQAFHWFANPLSLAEFRRVLAPGGALALVWNVRDQSVPWVRRLTEIMAPHVGDAPRHDSGRWRSVFPAEGFGPLSECRFSHSHDGHPEDVVLARVMSVSFIAALADRQRAAVERQVREVMASTPELAGDSVSFPYETVAYVCRRID
jgi:SAM-dependent methyltransferase